MSHISDLLREQPRQYRTNNILKREKLNQSVTSEAEGPE